MGRLVVGGKDGWELQYRAVTVGHGRKHVRAVDPGLDDDGTVVQARPLAAIVTQVEVTMFNTSRMARAIALSRRVRLDKWPKAFELEPAHSNRFGLDLISNVPRPVSRTVTCGGRC